MYKTIVATLDGSDVSEQVIRPVTDLAKQLSAKVLLVEAVDSLAQRVALAPPVLEAPSAAAGNLQILQSALDAEKEASRDYLAAHRDAIAAQGIECEAYVGEGPAAEVILNVVEQHGADLIAICTHGRGGLRRVIFGSTADAVLRQAPVPVFLVRAK